MVWAFAVANPTIAAEQPFARPEPRTFATMSGQKRVSRNARRAVSGHAQKESET
jgi:hypothetical protein